jgi:Ca2+-binding RTX toxin-like protein
MIGDGHGNEFTGLNEGVDTVQAGDGADTVDGGAGADVLDGGAGIDQLGFVNASAAVTVDLGADEDSDGDTLSGFEDILGSRFRDDLTGDGGPNTIEGGQGADTIAGLDGDDTLAGDFLGVELHARDSADGGAGTDACDAERETNCETHAGARAFDG